jgi:uncharacterized protein involved in outer membrane biogenesis
MRRRLLWIFGIAAGLLVILVVGVAIFIATFDANRLIAPAQAHVKAITGRDLMIGGGASLQVSLRPRLVVNEVSLANAPWAGAAPLATAKRIAVQLELVPLLSGRYEVIHFELTEPAIALATDARGRGNWEFDAAASQIAAEPSAKTPVGTLAALSIDALAVTNGAVSFKDGRSGKVTAIAIDALSLAMRDAKAPIHAEFRGRVDAIPIDIKGDLGALEALAAQRWPYPVAVAGKIADRETTLKTQVRVDGRTTVFDPLELAFGGHALKGRVAFTGGGARPRLVVEATAESLSAADLRAAGGAATKTPAPPAKTSQASRFVFPETEVPLDALRAADADIKLRIGRVAVSERFVLQQVDVHFTIDNGRLEAPALKANLFGGGLTARLAIDASRAADPTIAVRADARDMDLGSLRAMLDMKGDVRGSRVALSVDLKMHGSSPHAWASDASGSALMTVSRGTLATGRFDQGGVLESLLSAINPFHQTDASTELLCAVARLPLAHGVAHIDRSLAMETTKAGVSASGTVDFRNETLDLAYNPRVRHGINIDIAQVAQLVRLRGPFRDPEVHVDAVASAGAAARLGAAIGTGGLSVLGEAVLQKGAQGGASLCDVALGKAVQDSRDAAKSSPASSVPPDSATKILPWKFRR